jgi:hypothetical protein
MKASIRIVFCMFFVIALLVVSCGSPQTEEAVVEPEEATASNPLVGAWKVTEVTYADPETPAETNLQPSYIIITKNHMSSIAILGEEPRAELPENPTDAQKAAEYDRLIAEVATYEIEGNTLTQHYLVTQNPNTKPSDFWSSEYRFEGDDLFLDAKADQNGPLENPFTLKLVRVE